MGFSVCWGWLAALSCLLCLGGEVQCNCTDVNIQIDGGHYTLTKGLQSGSLLIYHCPEGYYPYPHLTRLCQPNHSWRPAPKRFSPQRCRTVECPDPNVLENGNVSPSQEKYQVTNETTYECFSGFTMRGSSRRVCLPNGKWSGSTPICSRDWNNCADPGIPPGASRTGNIFGINNTVKYSCNGNLFLVGSSERTCQENGQWTGKEPACYYKHTYDTSLEVSQAFGSAIRESLTTLEPIDDTQEGRRIRMPKNGTLNIYIAVDISESVEEKYINAARNTVTQLISKISSFAVSPNYEILFFSSEVLEVVNILDFIDGTIQLNTVMDKLKNFQTHNAPGTDLNLVFKTFLERMAVIKQRVGEEAFKEHRHVLIMFSDGAYNMGGSPVPAVERIKNMVYMDHTNEGGTQSREEHLDIYIFAIGADIFDDDLQPLTAGTGGRHYFRMSDMEKLQDTFDEMIDEEEVKGLCGLHKDHDHDRNKRKKYPWWASINIQKDGATQKCLGSLVTPQFVLTAAHCFKFGVLPEDITVDIDDGQGKVKKIKDFTIHPKYNVSAKVDQGVAEFYDYNVALVQLKEDVVISTAVRPICIPCTQETSDALKLVGESTCKQQEQLLLKTDNERLNFLHKTRVGITEKDVSAKLGSTRDECIKHALKAPGITTNNPKDAVTDNFLCTGGQFPYRDDIACKGDSGGAVFKDYEQRTIQYCAFVRRGGSCDLLSADDVAELLFNFHKETFELQTVTLKTQTDINISHNQIYGCLFWMDRHNDILEKCHTEHTGDSGGAVFKDYEQRTIQVALVSWGTKDVCQGGGSRVSGADSRDFHMNLFRVIPFLKSILGNADQDDYAPLQFLES